MGSTPSATPDPSDAAHSAPPVEAGSHDFEAQKRIHQQIRNDPDYDDWEYGTEPLPHEAWIAARRAAAAQPPEASAAPES
ncbi:MAG: hypothetical protein VKO26_07520 [Cyanobacteriota bacterium]|nr:hypothetical protein [Cyanobacteriota bacterium]